MQFVLKLKNEKFVVNKDTMILNICVTFHWFNLDLEKKWREKNTIEYIIPNRISREKIFMQNFGNAYMYSYKLSGLKRLATLHELSIAL